MNTSTSDHVTQEMFIERWQQAQRVLLGLDAHEREHHFNMRDWGRRTACGTVACLAGFCALDPWFRDQGFSGEIGQELGSKMRFVGTGPEKFFGQGGCEFIFYRIFLSFEEVAERVGEYIDYLKADGHPGWSPADCKADDHEDDEENN